MDVRVGGREVWGALKLKERGGSMLEHTHTHTHAHLFTSSFSLIPFSFVESPSASFPAGMRVEGTVVSTKDDKLELSLR